MNQPIWLDPNDPAGPPVPVLPATAMAFTDDATFQQEATQAGPPLQYPSLGRLVRVLVDPVLNDGADVAPAVITRVWSSGTDRDPATVNVRCFLDSAPAQGAEWATSRHLWPDEATARSQQDSTPPGSVSVHAFWPGRD